MLKLRPYEKQDARIIAGWIRDEAAFRKWSADRYESHPVSGKDRKCLELALEVDSWS